MIYYIVKTQQEGEVAGGLYMIRDNAEKCLQRIAAKGGKARIMESDRLLRPTDMKDRIASTSPALSSARANG